jgi:hypothetical protein
MMVISLAEDDEEKKLRVRQRSDGTNTIGVHVRRVPQDMDGGTNAKLSPATQTIGLGQTVTWGVVGGPN